MKRYVKLFENWNREEEIILTSRRGRTIELIIRHGKIDSVNNNSDVYFPFVESQPFQIPFLKSWACHNGFKWNGEDSCKPTEKKIFGIKTKDVPIGHSLRHAYPRKFKD
jgi:hypothetical protein